MIEQSTEEHEQMIQDCSDRESKMSNWDEEFITSISDQIDGGGSLTEKQEAKLIQIWEKVTAQG